MNLQEGYKTVAKVCQKDTEKRNTVWPLFMRLTACWAGSVQGMTMDGALEGGPPSCRRPWVEHVAGGQQPQSQNGFCVLQ